MDGSNMICHNIFWEKYPNISFIGLFIKRILAIPRSIHEVIWGILFIQIIGLNIWVTVFAIVIPYSALTARALPSSPRMSPSPRPGAHLATR